LAYPVEIRLRVGTEFGLLELGVEVLNWVWKALVEIPSFHHYLWKAQAELA